MKDPNRILFISQEIYPYLSEETPIRMLNRQLPELFQSNGYETRTFMPKFSEINERRNQLHDVIRLSGANLVIDESDHPLLIKVTSIQNARLQIYFIDNDEYFRRRKGAADVPIADCEYNDERCIFFARGVLSTVEKLRWTPQIINCSGWMAALAPLYLKKGYANTPFFRDAKVVLCIDDNEYNKPFSTKFAQKLLIDGVSSLDVRSINGFPVAYEDLMRLAIDNADAIVFNTKNINQRVMNYAEQSGKPLLPFAGDNKDKYLDFYNSLLPVNNVEE